MEDVKLTVQEATEILLMSQSSVYAWIERGKLKTEDTPTGKLIVISKKELEKIKEYNLKSKRNKVSKKNLQNEDDFQEIPVIDAEFSSNYEENVTIPDKTPENVGVVNIELINLIKNLSSKTEDLAFKAGKYELLEDMRKKEADNATFWQNEYFRVMKESELKLQEKEFEIIALKKEIDDLKAKYHK